MSNKNTTIINGDEYKINTVFKPLEGAQSLVMSCKNVDRILLTGGRGGGKSDLCLAYWRANFVNQNYGNYARGMVIGVSYKSLNSIVDKAKKMFSQFNDGSKFLSASGSLVYKWPTGETLSFRVINDENSYNSVLHGGEVNFMVFEELSSFPSLDVYDMCLSANRNSFVPERDSPINPETGEMELLPPLRSMSISSTNPYGPSARAIRERFIEPADYGEVITTTTEVYSAVKQEKVKVETTQVSIFMSLFENPYLPASYAAELSSIKDEKKRSAWLLGTYDDDSDTSMFGGCWDKKHNVLPAFTPPQNWKKFRSYDHGQSAPFVCLWFAISDGSDFYIDGKKYNSVKGSVYFFNEWYGAVAGKPNVGIQMLSSEIAKGIIYRELEMGLHGSIKAGPADAAIYTTVDGHNLAENLAKHVQINGKRYKGPTFFPSDKSGNTRPLGYERLREGFARAKPNSEGQREFPAIYVTENCDQGFLATVPQLQRDPKKPDDTSAGAIDHCADVARYVVNNLQDTFTSTTGRQSGYF